MANPPSKEYHQSELSVWEVTSRKKLHSIVLAQWIRSLSISDKGDLLVVATSGPKETGNFANDGLPRQVRVYAFPAMKEIACFESPRHITSAVVSSDGQLIAAATASDDVKSAAEVVVWETNAQKIKHTIKETSHQTVQIRFSPDGKTIALADVLMLEKASKLQLPGVFIREFKAATGEFVRSAMINEAYPTTDMHFIREGAAIVIDYGYLISIWDRQTGAIDHLPKNVFPHPQTRGTTVSKDEKWLIAGMGRSTGRPVRPPRIVIWDLGAQKAQFDWQWEKGGPPVHALTSDKKTLAIGGDKVHLFDLSTK